MRSLEKIFSYENALVLVLGLTFGIVFLDRSALNVLMPFIVTDLQLNATQVGLVGGALSLTWAVTNFLAGRASDLSGRRKPLLLAALIAFSACTMGTGLASSFATLLAARLLLGATQGPAAPLVMVLAAEGSSPRRRAFNSGVIGTFNPLVAAVVGPVALVALAEAFGWRQTFCLAGIPGLLAALLIALFVRDTGQRASTSPVAATGHGRAMAVRDVMRTRNIWVCTFSCACLWSFAGLISGFLPLYLVHELHVPPVKMGALLSIAGGVSLIAGNLLLGLSDRIGHKPVAIAAGFASLAAPLGALYFADSFVTLTVLMCVGFTAMFTMPLFFMAIPANSIPSSSFGTAMGLITGVAELLGSAIVALAGWMAELSSLRTPFYIAIALALLWGSSAFLLRSALAESRSETWSRGLSSENAS